MKEIREKQRNPSEVLVDETFEILYRRELERTVSYMALETLKDVKEIGGFKVVDRSCDESCENEDGSFDWELFDSLRKEYPIHITHDKNMISFKIQNGPIKEVGVNGCQVDTIIEAAKLILFGLNKNLPSIETSIAITRIEEALMWLKKRTEDREKRGVEGKNKK